LLTPVLTIFVIHQKKLAAVSGPRTNADKPIRTNAETWYKSTNADNFCPKGPTPTIHTD
jgi:hypothetical protein